MATETKVRVQGMSCGHCTSAIESEVARIAGVTAVHAHRGTGVVAITSDAPLDHAAIVAAVAEAGYGVDS